MKRILKIIVAIVSAWFIYLAVEQVYLYYHHDGQNFFIGISNQNSEEPMNIKVYLDESIIIDTVMDMHPSYLYCQNLHVDFGRHQIKIMRDDKLIYQSCIMVFLNKSMIVDCYEDNSVNAIIKNTDPYII